MNALFQPQIDLEGATVLVTGGTGSFGRQFVRTVLARYNVAKLIVFSRDEFKQFEMERDPAFSDREEMRYFLGDVRDLDRLKLAFRGVDYVAHTAAIKHIPAAEYNPFECIQTNVHGAENIVRAAMDSDVKRVVALSTDKAVSPINLYGASKLASDKIFVAARNIVGSGEPLFSVVRYGNVVGSRGSVVPLFSRMVKEGATSLPITDPRMTRFWITLQQGVDFVLSSFSVMEGGEIFIPKIPSMRINDLATVMAPDLPQEIVGIRPGEKLHEAMITEDDARWTADMDDRYVIRMPGPGERHFASGERHMPEDFRYASDNNPEWLSTDDLKTMLSALNL
jgi:UDP-N-acetylglucosamine 4,6-dehydratase/5-epimerase